MSVSESNNGAGASARAGTGTTPEPVVGAKPAPETKSARQCEEGAATDETRKPTAAVAGPDLRLTPFGIVHTRMLDELCLVGILKKARRDGHELTPEEVLEDLKTDIGNERKMIQIIGRKEAAALYGWLEGITSDMKMVDYILDTNLVGYYEALLAGKHPDAADFTSERVRNLFDANIVAPRPKRGKGAKRGDRA